MNSQLERRIKNIIIDLNKHVSDDKIKLLSNLIKKRLDKSLIQYYDDLNNSLEKLNRYDDKYQLRLIKKLNKEAKQ